MKISVVIPVYKAKECLRALYDRLTGTLRSTQGLTDYEIIFIEDCGRDGSWESIEFLASGDFRVRAIQLSRNFGQHYCITAGLEISRGDWAVIMDCDLQDRPEDIPLLWEKAQKGFDVVNARRVGRRDPFWKRLASRSYHFLLRFFSGLSYDPQVANFRIINRKVIAAYLSMRENFRSFGAQVHWLGFSTAYVDIKHGIRCKGKSSYTIGKLIAIAVDTITAFSNKPLLVSVGIGFFIFFSSLGISLCLVVRKIVWSVPIEGWVGLMVSLWFLGGMIIANLGIVGLYIGKIYDETRQRPIYVISKKINC